MLYSGLIVDNTYQIIEEIGSGGMGVVYLAFHIRLEKYVVMKKIKNSNANIAMLRNEVDILKGLHHPYLPQVYDFIQYEGYLYTIIDYIDGYDLKCYIESGQVFSEGQLIKWLRQLCNVLGYLHNHTPQVLHTDIKPANIIITGSGDICLIDFGISLSGSDRIKGVSREYASPEQCYNVQCISSGCYEECVDLDERVDIYSIAATFYHIMTGIMPDVYVQQPKIAQCNTGYSEAFVAIIDKCMETDRDNRYRNAVQIEKALDNMYKMDAGYKKYIWVQLIASLLAGVMIVSGAIMTIKGFRSKLTEEYESQFNSFLQTHRTGNTVDTIQQGYRLLNETRYASVMDENTRALILHTVADGYYNSEDFYNAAYYYKQAVEHSNDPQNIQLYYRDYIFSLVKNNQVDKAREVLAEFMSRYPDSQISVLVEAQIYYKNKEYSAALNKIQGVLPYLSDDTDSLYSAYLISGDCYHDTKNYAQAMECYSNANKIQESEETLRKLGNAILVYANTVNKVSLYTDAQNVFESLCTYYTPGVDDIFNYAQCYLLCKGEANYKKCITILEEYIAVYGEDCRVYIMLSIASDALNDGKTRNYCTKARTLYNSISAEEKKRIDAESMNQIKDLYKKHCGGLW
ncbi:MAG: protein kinase [Ruminococcus sp.]|nr:protein kinase [Ruminococcus sp.]